MRIVLDTNVVLSALLWRGTPYRLLQSLRSSEHVLLFSSVALLTELAEVLVRPVAASHNPRNDIGRHLNLWQDVFALSV